MNLPTYRSRRYCSSGKRLCAFLLVAATIIAQCPAVDTVTPGDQILGLWHTTDDKSVVRVFKQDDKYFAKIVSLKEPNWPQNDEQGMGGQPMNDRHNPNPQLRTRPIVGLEFMRDFVYSGRNGWTGGKLYDPESGKTYHGKISLIATNRLQLRGYVGISAFGRTVFWTRQPRDQAGPSQIPPETGRPGGRLH